MLDDSLVLSNDLSFSDYMMHARERIKNRRGDLPKEALHKNKYADIINANSPFEFFPTHPLRANNGKLKYGALLIHGLLNSPFYLSDIALRLQENGVLCRGLLLPGHGTVPDDLLSVSYQEWIEAVRYGVATLKKDVEEIFLIGYSTGATLSIYQASLDAGIRGLILLSPAVKIKTPVTLFVKGYRLLKQVSQDKDWLYHREEIDYAKYQSITFNAVTQVAELSKVIHPLSEEHSLKTPMLMITSLEDETISSDDAIDFFSALSNPQSQLLLYTASDYETNDSRVLVRSSSYTDLQITKLSHGSIPFAPDNTHYGQAGDFVYASHADAREFIYGTYNYIEEAAYDLLYQSTLAKHKRRVLTYNPDFDFMMERIVEFVLH